MNLKLLRDRLLDIVFQLIIVSTVFAQTDSVWAYSNFVFSPDGKHVIVQDVYEAEITFHPWETYLYHLPLDCSKRIKVPNESHYQWSQNGVYFYTSIAEYFSEQSAPSKIVIYNDQGEVRRMIEQGTSLSPDFATYKTEYDDQGNWVAPRLMVYDFETNESKTYFEFGDSLTFWGQQAEVMILPKPATFYRRGFMTVLYKKGSDTSYTYIVHKNKGILFMMEGDYTQRQSLVDGLKQVGE